MDLSKTHKRYKETW